jgi:hypothetical protein
MPVGEDIERAADVRISLSELGASDAPLADALMEIGEVK